MAAKNKSKASISKNSSADVMEALLKKYGSKTIGLSARDVVSGTVTSIQPGRVLVDIGAKAEGLVAEKAYKEAEEFIQTLKVGDKITAKVIVPETPDGFVILSLRQAAYEKAWKKIEDAEKNDTVIDVVVKNAASSGLVVDLYGIGGFIPKSHISKNLSHDLSKAVGRVVKTKVVDIVRDRNRVILSERAVSEAEEIERVAKALKTLKVGEIYDGKVTSIYDFGAFVEIPVKVGKEISPVEGLVHISELAWEKVDHPTDEVEEGHEVRVKVLAVEDEKLSLSIKQTLSDPWEEIEEKYPKDTKLEAVVTKLSDFGVFVQLEPGVEGLIHITKIPPGRKLNMGDSVNVYVEGVDPKEKRISLGLVLTAKPVGYR